MTETEQKALALVNEVRAERNQDLWRDVGNRKAYGMVLEALCRAIEQHEAFRQEVSDAVVATYNNGCSQRPYVSPRDYMDGLRRFIIDPPVDPLVEAVGECDDGTWETKAEYAQRLRAAMKARGYEWRKIEEQDYD